MKINIKARIQNGYIVEAQQVYGQSMPKFAEYLGVPYSVLNGWLNFKNCPDINKMLEEKPDLYLSLSQKFLDLINQPLETIFPEELNSPEFRERPKSINQNSEVENVRFFNVQKDLYLLANNPENEYFEKLDTTKLIEICATKYKEDLPNEPKSYLSPRQVKIIKMYSGIDGQGSQNITEIAKELGIGKERIRQILYKAFRIIRHRVRSNKTLKDQYER